MAFKSKNKEKVERIIAGSEPPASAVNFLKSQKSSVAPEWARLKPQWDEKLHAATRKARQVNAMSVKRQVPEITIADQKRYVRRANDLMFSNSVTREWSTLDASGKEDKLKASIAKTIESVLKQNAYDALNRERFTSYFAACQMATLWQSFEKLDANGAAVKFKYGDKESNYKITCQTYDPIAGDSIHPVYDTKGDLVLLGIGTSSWVYGEEEQFFIILSAKGVQTLHLTGGKWEHTSDEIIQADEIGKIPAAFIERGAPTWENSSPMTDEKESKLIDNSRLIDHNSVPDRVLSIDGDGAEDTLEQLQLQMGIAKKNADGETVPVPPEQRTENEGLSRNYMGKGLSMQIQTWPGATSALEYHMKTLQDLQDGDIGLPDLTPKAIANISTDTLQLILEVSALRVVSESGKIEKFMRREISIIKELIKPMYKNNEWEVINDLDFEVKIHPFQISNRLQNAQIMQIENGNLPVLSHEESVKQRVGAEKFDSVWEQIQKEMKMSEQNSQFSL